MEEDEYRSTYHAVNTRRCVLEKALHSRKVTCSCAQRILLADREAVGCTSDTAQRRCQTLLAGLRENARFVLHLTHIGGPLPHNKELRVQVGGMLGLQALLYPERAASDTADDVFALLNAAQTHFGDLERLPYQDIVKHVRHFQPRTRQSRR
ncbi:MAG: hypothetical protein K8I04_07080 [Gammaproteobacteria bacterium]|nr:hypothetical protein [Gammaproteobacteria bacterium]